MRYAGRAGAAMVALVLGLAATACGGGDGDSGVARVDDGTTTSAQRAARDSDEAMLDYAECMRENGVDMPDPQGGGFVITPDTDPSQRDRDGFRRADARCRKHLADARPPQLSEEQEDAFRQAALAHARCMREHGIDMPDPTAVEGGGVSVPLDGLDIESEEFKTAQRACEGKLRAAERTLREGDAS